MKTRPHTLKRLSVQYRKDPAFKCVVLCGFSLCGSNGPQGWCHVNAVMAGFGLCATDLGRDANLSERSIYPLETPAIWPKKSCGIKRAIRRALYFVSSKTVGGSIRPLNSLPETGKTKEF